jgi:hypothetical protein
VQPRLAGAAISEASTTAKVHATVAADHLRVRLERRFTAADVEAVKRIPGRRWEPHALSWRLPRSEAALAALRAAFGDRLEVYEEVGDSKRLPPDHAPSAMEGDAVHLEPLVAELRRIIRLRGYSRKTETAYASWLRRYGQWVGSNNGAVPFGEAGLVAFLEHLEHEGLAARSRNQAASALNFVLRDVLQHDDAALPRAKGPVRMPLVLSHHEVMRLLDHLQGKYQLIGMLLYSSGLRVGECMSLRIKDVDFELRQILVRDGKGRKDRYVPLATRAIGPLRAPARCIASQGPRRRPRAALAVPVPCEHPERRPVHGADGPLVAPRHRSRARVQECAAQVRHHEASDMPHTTPLVRHRNPAKRL